MTGLTYFNLYDTFNLVKYLTIAFFLKINIC
jgi:hypothetical protein